MRIGLAVEGSRGDVYPMLAAADWLREQGHQVRICASPDFDAEVRERGFDFHPVGESVRAFLRNSAEAVTQGGLALMLTSNRYMRESVSRQFRDLQAGLKDVDHVIGAGVQLGAGSIAELFGLPYRYVVYCPSLIPSRVHAPPTVELQNTSPWMNRILWWVTLGVLRFGMKRMLDSERAVIGLPPVSDAYRALLTDRPILAVDRGLAPPAADFPLAIDSIPCLHPFDPEPLPDKLADFLDRGEAPIYVGFGSMTDPRPDRTTSMLLEAIERLGGRAVLSSGWAELGASAVPDHVFVSGPVSHAALFPRMSAIVHHGGAGTTTTAARAGVPQLLVPHLLDQFYWSTRVRDLGIGPPAVRRRRLCADDLVEALQACRDNDVLTQRASELGRQLRKEASDRSAYACLTETIPKID